MRRIRLGITLPTITLDGVGLKPRKLLPFLIAAMFFGIAMILASISQDRQNNDPFTQLWIQPCEETACDYVTVGIRNFEYQTQDYRVNIRYASSTGVNHWQSLTLDHTEQTEERVPLTALDNNGTITVDLYLADNPDEVYRQVFLRRNNSGGE